MSELLSIVRELEALSLKKLEASLDEGLKQKIIELKRINKGSAKKKATTAHSEISIETRFLIHYGKTLLG